jgi:anaerobic nitric oxide reductase transcription regulator
MKETTLLYDQQHAEGPRVLLELARDLTRSLAERDRYERLLTAMRRLIACDAACLLRLEGDDLVPVAGHGLTDEALVRRYPRNDHPRLDIILSSDGAVRFPVDSKLPDPFDGYLASDPQALQHIHACLGCALTEGGQVVGALTVDALSPDAFDALDPQWLEALAALAGAAIHTAALIDSIERLAERKGAVARELQRSAAGMQFLGNTAVIERLRRDISLVARSDLTVLIFGETGVGKELVAQQVHAESARRDEALIHVNCAALPESIAESELFGHIAGAFTGAIRDRAGKFEIADGATLFLDEIGELPLTLQPKLLRVLQHGEIQRVGDDRTHCVDVRVVAATNRDLEKEVAAGRFRADLFHRLAAYPISVPPLRERREDIPLLAAHFLGLARRRLGLGPVRLSPDARESLMAADWPGNARELENVVGRATLRAAAGHPREVPLVLEPGQFDLPASSGGPPKALGAREETRPDDARNLTERTRDFQRRSIEAAVQASGGNWAAAARQLGMHRSNLHHLARKLGLRE